MPKSCLSPVPWEQDGFLRVKMEEEEEASLSQVQESSFGHTVHPEAACLRFQHFCFEEASSPLEALARLRKLCHQWLQPETHSKEQMLELLVLEQFLGTRPPEIQSWVGAQCPKSGEGAAVLVEDLTRALDKRGRPREAGQTLRGNVGPVCPHQMDVRKTSGPYKEGPPAHPSCEAGALGDSPPMRPDLTSREKTPSEERWDPPDGCGTEPPGTCSGRKPPTCGEWGKTLQSPSEAHQKSQARRTPYTGSECGKAFRQSAHLAQHRGVHTGAKPHACMECGKAFGQLTHLSQHRRVHTGEKPYACEECDKASRRSTHLSQRGWTHTGERPCTCDACGQAFSQSTRLTQHQCVHTAEKP